MIDELHCPHALTNIFRTYHARRQNISQETKTARDVLPQKAQAVFINTFTELF
jgi:hypothetical protein